MSCVLDAIAKHIAKKRIYRTLENAVCIYLRLPWRVLGGCRTLALVFYTQVFHSQVFHRQVFQIEVYYR
jgi:hypothetical protein